MEVKPHMKIFPDTTRKLALDGVVAAAYVVLTALFHFLSYGNIQFRISEALCVLPFLLPCTSWGLFVGCFISNFFNPEGFTAFDLVFGSLATLLAALCTVALGRRNTLKNQILACLMPVLFNAFIVGAVLNWAYQMRFVPDDALLSYALNILSVGFGEAVVMFALGLPLLRWLPRQQFFQDQITKYQ